jgi:hypothetical protein
MPYELTPEQLALREQRRITKLRQLEAKSSSAKPDDESREELIIQRPWISLGDGQKFNENGLRIKILTFNVRVMPLICIPSILTHLYIDNSCLPNALSVS